MIPYQRLWLQMLALTGESHQRFRQQQCVLQLDLQVQRIDERWYFQTC